MYLPKEVLNVHSLELGESSLTCQKPELASRTENCRHSCDYFINYCSHRKVFSFNDLVEVAWILADYL